MSLFHQLATLADQLATEPGRLKKRAAIAQAIRTIAAQPHSPDTHGEALPPSAQDAGLFCLYLAGQPFPEADSRKLNAGGALLSRALKEAAHTTEAALTAAYRRHGDLGAAAYDLLLPHAPATPTLTLTDLATAFDTLATARTTAARSATLLALLRRATALEAKYLLKLMLADMRIGVKQSLIEEAIAEAASTGTHPITPAAVRHAVMLEADLARAVTMAFNNTLAEARMRLFHPLGFMLASPVDTPEEAIARFTPAPPKPEKPAKKARRKKSEPPFETVLSTEQPTPDIVISTEAQRSGETPVFPDANPTNIIPTETSEPQTTPAEGHPPSAREQDQAAYLEDKYDGMRAQLHCGDPTQPSRVALYSRNREDITHSFPEIVEAFAHVTQPLILDGEILGWNPTTKQALPFAILGQRIGRRNIDDTIRQQVPVIFMAFDLLYEDNELLLHLPLSSRRQRLENLAATLTPITTSPLKAPTPEAQQLTIFATASVNEAPPIPRLHLSPAQLVTTAGAIDRAYADARARANEGVMLKSATSHYLPGRRGLAWVKLKRTLETLDVVITGAEFGHGRRAGLLSDYTFAIQNEHGELLNVGKAYSGVTDAEILELTTWLQAHTLEDHGHFRTVEPIRILEVAFNNIMRSTRHASGFALRFPRILRIRDDKPLAEIDTRARVEEIYQSQPDRPIEN